MLCSSVIRTFVTLNIMNRNNLTLTGALLGSALFALSACSSDSDGDGSSGTPEPLLTTTTSAAPEVTDVDPASFEMNGSYVFDVPMDDGTMRLCVMGDGSVTCSGNAPSRSNRSAHSVQLRSPSTTGG